MDELDDTTTGGAPETAWRPILVDATEAGRLLSLTASAVTRLAALGDRVGQPTLRTPTRSPPR